MKYRAAPFLVSFAFHALIIALCFPLLADRKFAHRVIPVDFVLLREEIRQGHAAQRAATDDPARAYRQTPAREAIVSEGPRRSETARSAASENLKRPGPAASAADGVSTGQAETTGALAVAAAPSAQGERRVEAGPGTPRVREKPETSGAAAGGQDAWRDAVWSELRRTVEKHKVYPDRAKRMNWEGKVDLSFRVFEDGTIRDIKVAKSSGFQVLDDAARDLLKKLRLSYRPVEKMRLELAVEYRLQ